MEKKRMLEIIDMLNDGFSRSEIARRLGISKSYVSVCSVFHKALEEERRGIEQAMQELEREKAEHRGNVEEVMRVKHKLSEMKAKEAELRDSVGRKEAEVREKARKEEEEYRDLTGRVEGLREECDKREHELREAKEYKKARKKLEMEYDVVERSVRAKRADLDIIQQEKELMKKLYNELKKGGTDEMISFFMHMNAKEKAVIFSFLSDSEIRDAWEEIMKMMMTRQVLGKVFM